MKYGVHTENNAKINYESSVLHKYLQFSPHSKWGRLQRKTGSVLHYSIHDNNTLSCSIANCLTLNQMESETSFYHFVI